MRADNLIVILGATPREVSHVRRSLDGSLSSAEIEIAISGVGKVAVERWTAALGRRREPPGLLLSIGFAGAIRPELNTGDLVLSNVLYASDDGESLRCDEGLLALAAAACEGEGLSYFVADTLTVGQPVRTASEKARLASTTSAWAVNMEDYWSATAARRASIPYISVRAIVDTWDQELPPFSPWLSGKGSVGQALAAGLAVVARPRLFPRLVDLARQAQLAQRSLGSFARAFVPRVASAPAGEAVGWASANAGGSGGRR